MNLPDTPFSIVFRVGKVKCRLTFDADGLRSEWSPRLPDRLNKKELRQYRAGRDALLAEVGKHVGPVLVVEVA